MSVRISGRALGASLILLSVVASPAEARELLDSGDTAWLLTATALVLLMTLPALALFYGGLVRAQNVLSVLMQCLAVAALVSLLWLVLGYSLAFDGTGPIVGGLNRVLLLGVTRRTTFGSIPESVFFAFQMTFAIITPALVIGAFVERIRFAAVLLWTALWSLIVYAPVAHWIWGGGFLAAAGTRDFAGGIVVHATAGAAALAVARVLGPRRGFPAHLPLPHSPGLTMAGAALLWVGWYGFNAGSAVAASGDAGMALVVTHMAAATAALVWMAIEWVKHGKPSLVGTATGVIAGLATITPASGYVAPAAAIVIGALAALACYPAIGLVKQRLGVDDSLDVMAVHGVGGILGSLLLALFMAAPLGGVGYAAGSGLLHQFGAQLLGVVVGFGWSLVVSWALAHLCRATVGLRVNAEEETEGLDYVEHGETAYNF